jgi:hypothetical protein
LFIQFTADGFANQIRLLFSSSSQVHSNNITLKFEAFVASHSFQKVTAPELVVLAQTGAYISAQT